MPGKGALERDLVREVSWKGVRKAVTGEQNNVVKRGNPCLGFALTPFCFQTALKSAAGVSSGSHIPERRGQPF